MRQSLTGLQEAVRLTQTETRGTVILLDAAAAPSSGASGDSNAILRALLEAGYEGNDLRLQLIRRVVGPVGERADACPGQVLPLWAVAAAAPAPSLRLRQNRKAFVAHVPPRGSGSRREKDRGRGALPRCDEPNLGELGAASSHPQR
jgi:hypothetical protein